MSHGVSPVCLRQGCSWSIVGCKMARPGLHSPLLYRWHVSGAADVWRMGSAQRDQTPWPVLVQASAIYKAGCGDAANIVSQGTGKKEQRTPPVVCLEGGGAGAVRPQGTRAGRPESQPGTPGRVGGHAQTIPTMHCSPFLPSWLPWAKTPGAPVMSSTTLMPLATEEWVTVVVSRSQLTLVGAEGWLAGRHTSLFSVHTVRPMTDTWLLTE